MKRSYWICSAILLVLVAVMIITGIVQDRKLKKAKLRDSAVDTLTAAGCVEVDQSYVPPFKPQSDFLGYDEVDLSQLNNVKTVFSSSSDSNMDGQFLFNKIGSTLLQNAKFYITSTKVSGRDATVKVHLFYNNNTEGDLELEYFYYDGEWRLSNTLDALKNLRVNGKDYDEVSASAYDEAIKSLQGALG